MSRERPAEPIEIGSVAETIHTHDGSIDPAVESARSDAMDMLRMQARAYKSGVTIQRVPDAPPVSSIRYTPFPDPDKGLTGGQMETWTIPPDQMSKNEFTVGADIAIRACACFRCLQGRSRHSNPEKVCERCKLAESAHSKGLCADRRQAKFSGTAKVLHCADGGLSEFHFIVAEGSKVRLKNDVMPEFMPQPRPQPAQA